MIERDPRQGAIAGRLVAAALLPATLVAGGCVQRTITITSEPSGALVWLNDREVGRTPVDVDFVDYGTYDVRLVRAGYEPLLTVGEAKAPLWDVVGLDLVAELMPVRMRSDVRWHYELEPAPADPGAVRDPLVERARALRTDAATE